MKPILTFVVGVLAASAAWAQSIDPKAEARLKSMGQMLAGTKTVSFRSHVTIDTWSDSGQKIQVARSQQISVRRPDGLAATVTGDDLNLKFVYDGKQVLLVNTDKQSYALADAPGTIDAMLDMLATDYGLPVPLADLLYADPYKTLIENARSGQHLGTGHVMDTKCDHLAFRQDAIDWQIWIEQGDKPLPRKLVITYKNAPGMPQYTAYFSDWNVDAQIPAEQFKLEVPQDMKRVDLVKTTEPKPAAKE